MSLPAFSARQTVLVNLVFLLVMATGLQVASRIPVDLFPDISFNSASVVTVWRGASAGEIERLVTKKLEDEIHGIVGIKELISYSSQGLSELHIEWEEGLSQLEYQAALDDLRAAIDRVDDMPRDAEQPIVRELSVSEVFNICLVALTDEGGVGEFTLREVARDLGDRLDRVPGVRRAELRGERERELQVRVDRFRAHQYDLTLSEISRTIASNNQNFAAGSFTDAANQEVTVRGLGQFASRAALAETVVKKNPDGSHVRLKDLADVVEGFRKRRMIGRYDGKPAISLGISKQSDADIIDTVARVRAAVADYRGQLPDGIGASVTWDGAKKVKVRMQMMRSNLILGVAFVLFVLWLTVGFRNAMLAIVGVPFAFLAALILFPAFDLTINVISLVGFVMMSGMLVDDAIIVLENIYRHVEDGESALEAVIGGTEEVMWPVIAAIATTVAAFIPMLMVSGTSGEFMSILPKTVIACLLGSLIEAMLILPAHYIDFGPRRRPSGSTTEDGGGAPSGLGFRRVERRIEWLRAAFLRGQDVVLDHRYAFLAMSVTALYFAIGLARHIPVDLFPSDYDQIMITVETPTDFGIEQTNEVVLGIERSLDPIRDELTDVSTWVGMAMNPENQQPLFGVNYGILYVAFPNTAENVANPARVLNLIRDVTNAHRADHPGQIENIRVVPPRNGPLIGKPIAVRILSDDYGEAKQIANEMKAELATIPGVFNIEDNVPLGPRELQIALNEQRASIYGLTFDELGSALMAANEGLVPSSFKDPQSDEDVDIRVLLVEEQRRSVADLLEAELRTPGGYLVKLGDVADIELKRGYRRLYHNDAQRAVIVYADVDNLQATSISVNETMRLRFSDVPQRHPGVTLLFGGEYQATDNAFADMGKAFGLAILAIYGILAAQFRSYWLPLIVMSVIAFSFVGVALGMFVMGYPLSMYVVYAVIGLAGVVVNGSLVLIDFTSHERELGASARAALRTASHRRFRPILLTTVTTIAGLLPMAIGLSGYSRQFAPFATAIVSGLAASSLVTLFVVPAAYLALEDLQDRVRGRGRLRTARTLESVRSQ